MSAPLVLLAGGGTGGHVFPMIAVADALRSLASVNVLFVGTARGLEARVIPGRGDRLVTLDIVPIQGGGWRGAVRGAVKAALSLPQARALLKRERPLAVLSVGGYAAGPVALAARFLGIPLALLEPNGALGLANRWLAPFARRAYLAFPELAGKFRPSVALYTGVPLRQGFAQATYAPEKARVRVLVLGGSQGALFLNENVPGAIARIEDDILDLSVVHQAGRDKDDEVRRRYDMLGVPRSKVQVVPFLDGVADALASADIVIGRAGASAVAEICAVGRPSILVPYPFAADDHQKKNALALQAAGAAVCLAQSDTSVERLAGELRALAGDPDRRAHMAQAASLRGQPDAAKIVAQDLLELAGVPLRGAAAARVASAGHKAPSVEAVHV